jgi:hypothetical protein
MYPPSKWVDKCMNSYHQFLFKKNAKLWMCGNNNFIRFKSVIWSEMDVVDPNRGHELGFLNFATSSLFVYANLAPPTMES